MAMRSALTSLPTRLRAPSLAAATGRVLLLSDGKGRVLSEEERTKESIYIQKMEKERQEKLKKRLEQEKSADDTDKINGSLARRAIKDLMAHGLIRMVSVHSSQQIYTRATNT